jgi:hypothetical protein
MPSRFASLLGGVAGIHRDFFAASVSLTQAGQTASTPAVLHKARAETRVIDGTTVIVTTRQVRFTELESLRDDATVTIDGLLWTVQSTLDNTTGVTAILTRTEATEPARTGYRR